MYHFDQSLSISSFPIRSSLSYCQVKVQQNKCVLSTSSGKHWCKTTEVENMDPVLTEYKVWGEGVCAVDTV